MIETENGNSQVGAWLAIGVGVGVAIGTAMGNIGAGIAIGIAIGVSPMLVGIFTRTSWINFVGGWGIGIKTENRPIRTTPMNGSSNLTTG